MQDSKEDSMSHVDEGTLHACLDGELPSPERAALEAHLAQCGTCRASLAEERALLERASALLGSARPVERPVPPFEQLRRSPRRSPWHVRTPFAWAASIMLAVGAGYYLRGPDSGPAPASTPPQPVTIAHYSDAPVTAQEKLRASRRPPPAVSRADERVQAADRLFDKAGAGAESAAAASGVVAIQPQMQLRNAAPAAVAAPKFSDSLRLSEAIVTTGAQRNNVAELRGRAVTTQWQIISRGVARTLLGADPVGLPGLATRRIRRSPAPDAIVVVEQALDSSTVIQIFQRPAADAFGTVDGAPSRRLERDRAAREAAPAAAPAPAERLARFVGKLRVEIAGPLSPDSLNKLLEQVEPLP